MDEDVISIRNDKGNKSVIVSSNDIESLSLNDNNSYYRILDLISSSGYDINVIIINIIITYYSLYIYVYVF